MPTFQAVALERQVRTKLRLERWDELLGCVSPTRTACTEPQGDGTGWINMNRFIAGQKFFLHSSKWVNENINK